MRADFYASESHFADHLAPIWHALGDAAGPFWCRQRLLPRVQGLGVRPQAARFAEGQGPVVIAAIGDMVHVPEHRPVVFLEHGVGQTYGGAHPSYSAPYLRSPHRQPLGQFDMPSWLHTLRGHASLSVGRGLVKP